MQYETINERLETLETLPVTESKCELAYHQPTGRVSVMGENLYELLQKAVKVQDKNMHYGEWITLVAENSWLYANLWVNEKYSRLPFCVGAKVEREFSCAVRLADLKELLSIQNTQTVTVGKGYKAKQVNKKMPRERVDLQYNYDTHTLNVRSANWVTNLKCLTDELPVNAALIEREYTKEEIAELKWVKKSAAKENNRPVLQFVNVVEQDGKRCMMAADGYRIHVSLNHVSELPLGLLDTDETMKFPDATDIMNSTTADKVCVRRVEFEQAVKKALAAADITTDKTRHITLSFEGNTVVIAGASQEHGEVSSTLETTGIVSPRQFRMNAAFILDAINGSKADKIMLTFVPDKYDVVRLMVAPGRFAWLMPSHDKR